MSYENSTSDGTTEVSNGFNWKELCQLVWRNAKIDGKSKEHRTILVAKIGRKKGSKKVFEWNTQCAAYIHYDKFCAMKRFPSFLLTIETLNLILKNIV